jgi:hypothetical protein
MRRKRERNSKSTVFWVETPCNQGSLHLSGFFLVFSTLRTEEIFSYETSGLPLTIRGYNPEERTLHSHCYENHKANIESSNVANGGVTIYITIWLSKLKDVVDTRMKFAPHNLSKLLK